MKAFILTSIMILTLLKGNCQPSFNELSFSYGMGSTNGTLIRETEMALASLLASAFTLGLVNMHTENVRETGPILFTWKHIPGSKWGFGGSLGYLSGSYDEITGSIWIPDETVTHREFSILTIAAEFDYRYIHSEKATLYSGAALGLTFLSETQDDLPEKRTRGDAHLTLIGFRYGDKFGISTEFGIGFKGILNFGLSYRF